MEKKEFSSFEELHKGYWRGLFSGFVAKAKREDAPPMAYILNVSDVSVIDPEKWGSWNLSAQVTPVLSYKDTGLPEVLNMQLFLNDRPVAKGAAKAEWSRGLPKVTKFQYIPYKTEGIDEAMIGEIANNLGQFLERPDEYTEG